MAIERRRAGIISLAWPMRWIAKVCRIRSIYRPMSPIETAFRDGLGGGPVDHDRSHANFGVSTAFAAPGGLTLVPAINYEIAMDKSVIDADFVYFVLSVKK